MGLGFPEKIDVRDHFIIRIEQQAAYYGDPRTYRNQHRENLPLTMFPLTYSRRIFGADLSHPPFLLFQGYGHARSLLTAKTRGLIILVTQKLQRYFGATRLP